MEYPQCLKSQVGHIGETPIMCAVLKHPDGTIQHVLERQQFFMVIGWERDLPDIEVVLNNSATTKLPIFLASDSLRPFVEKYLQPPPNMAGLYIGRSGQRTRFYDARLLTKTSIIWSAADDEGVLRENQQHIARNCRRVLRHFAEEGVRAWINSVTGFVDVESIQDRTKRLLLDDPRDWEVFYPRGFWLVLERLYGYDHIPSIPPQNHPFGWFLRTYIYSVLDDHTHAELLARVPYEDKETNVRIHKLHQSLSDKGLGLVGRRRDEVWTLAKTSRDYRDFKARFDAVSPYAQLHLGLKDAEGRPTTFVVEQLAGVAN